MCNITPLCLDIIPVAQLSECRGSFCLTKLLPARLATSSCDGSCPISQLSCTMESSGYCSNSGRLQLHQPGGMDQLSDSSRSSIPPCSGWCEQRSNSRSTPRGCCQQKPNTAKSKRVLPNPERVPLRSLDEDTISVLVSAASPKRSRRTSAPEADEKWLSKSGRDYISIIAAREGVNGEGKFPFKTRICGCDNEKGYYKFGQDNIHEHVTPLIKSGADDEEGLSVTFSCWSSIKSWGTAIGNVAVPGLRWLMKKRRNGSGKRKAEGGESRRYGKQTLETKADKGLESLLFDMCEKVILRLPLKELFLFKSLSKSFKDRAGSAALLHLRGGSGEGVFTAINFFIKDEALQCTGLDMQSKTWRRLPKFSCLPKPDASLFKEYLLSGDGALMCANVSKVLHKEALFVFNLLTGETRRLPSLHYPRNPVLIHILVDSATNNYKVVAAGSSSSSGEENLSRRVEVYDSQTLQWAVASDVPGPEFALNEHQAGVYVDGILYSVAFLEEDGQKGVVAFDVKKGEWVKNRNCCVPYSLYSNILQLVESSGNVYLFSEQEHGGIVEHCIDELEFTVTNGEVEWELKSVIKVKKSGGRGLLVYPEFTCIPYGKKKLCVFNTIGREGVVYDVQNGMQSEELEPPPESQKGDNFFSLNPVAFTLQPNFTSKP